VESTLVLSRRDGSIICTTGRLYQDKQSGFVGPSTSAGQPSDSTSNGSASAEPVNGQDLVSDTQRVASQDTRVVTPAETLAASIFGFVHSATLLGRAIGTSHNNQESRDAARAGVFETVPNPADDRKHPDDEGQSTPREDQVQLLRMRTRRQEIIIYPDPSYLCCVVQSVGKQANGAT
jgi:hypothetical protein